MTATLSDLLATEAQQTADINAAILARDQTRTSIKREMDALRATWLETMLPTPEDRANVDKQLSLRDARGWDTYPLAASTIFNQYPTPKMGAS